MLVRPVLAGAVHEVADVGSAAPSQSPLDRVAMQPLAFGQAMPSISTFGSVVLLVPDTGIAVHGTSVGLADAYNDSLVSPVGKAAATHSADPALGTQAGPLSCPVANASGVNAAAPPVGSVVARIAPSASTGSKPPSTQNGPEDSVTHEAPSSE